jgi:hypothetical protein
MHHALAGRRLYHRRLANAGSKGTHDWRVSNHRLFGSGSTACLTFGSGSNATCNGHLGRSQSCTPVGTCTARPPLTDRCSQHYQKKATYLPTSLIDAALKHVSNVYNINY